MKNGKEKKSIKQQIKLRANLPPRKVEPNKKHKASKEACRGKKIRP